MGSQLVILTTDMKVFLCISSLVAATSASLAGALVGGHGIVGGHGLVGGHAVVGGQSSHQSVSKPFQGEARTTSQAKAFGSPCWRTRHSRCTCCPRYYPCPGTSCCGW